MRSEDQFHAAVVDLLHLVLNGQQASFVHFPAGGYFLSRRDRGRLSRLGLTPGWPDLLVVWHPGRQLWIELKSRNGQLSSAQQKKHSELVSLNIPVVVCRSEESVIAALEIHGVPHRKVTLQGQLKANGETAHVMGRKKGVAKKSQTGTMETEVAP